MRLLYYTDQVYMHGGLERVLANKLNYFSEHTAIELHVVTFQQENNLPCYPIHNKVTFHDLNINYNRNISFLHPSNIKHAPRHYLKLKRKIEEIQPDVIVVCNYEFGFYFIPLIAKKSIKIKEFHSSRHFNYLERLKNKNLLKEIKYKLSDYFEDKYDYLVLLTKDEQHYFKTNNTVVIPNAIHNIGLKTAELSAKRVITAGRIAPVKGFEYVIAAWRIVVETWPDWTLDIYGDGDGNYINKLKKQIEALNLNAHVFLKGATNDLESEMLESSIYVMSSLTECFPMVLLEAMSFGLPIVSFDCPNGPRNMIQHDVDGILVEYLNSEALACSIITLIKNKKKMQTFGIHGNINVQRFKEAKVMPLWLEIFKKKND